MQKTKKLKCELGFRYIFKVKKGKVIIFNYLYYIIVMIKE